MSSTFTTPSDDILISPGVMHSFLASGAISGGAFVKPAGAMSVVAGTEGIDNPLGVAAYEVAKGDYVTVYGAGSIVRCCAGSSITAGGDLQVGNKGQVNDDGVTYGGLVACCGIALDGCAANAAVRVLVK